MEPGGASSKTLPNWLDLPRDLTIQIFIKVGVVDLLCNAQSVCSSWRAIARDSRLYRVIDLYDLFEHVNHHWACFGCHKYKLCHNYELVVELATEAMDRSCGQAIEFSIGNPDRELKMAILYQLKYKTPGLKCLRLFYCSDVIPECIIEIIPKLPLLEEVEFYQCYVSQEVIEVLGRSCPKLKSFRLNDNCEYCEYEHGLFNDEHEHGLFNDVAFAIAGNMNPNLRSLHLFGNFMNNTGLEAILDRFSKLEYLDLRQCFNIDLNGDLLKRCQGIKTLRLPKDSTDDYDQPFESAWPSEDDSDGDFDNGQYDTYEDSQFEILSE